MPYNLDLVTERVREYLEVRHPRLDPANVRVIDENGHDWLFNILVTITGLPDAELDWEFDRYRHDRPQFDLEMEAWQGLGNDYITIPKCKPLGIGDGDDTGAVWIKDHVVHIWLRDCA